MPVGCDKVPVGAHEVQGGGDVLPEARDEVPGDFNGLPGAQDCLFEGTV